MTWIFEAFRGCRRWSGWLALGLAVTTGLLGCSQAPEGAAVEAGAAEAVRAVLDAQVAAWNAGDLEGFMDGYARTDSLRFASGGNIRLGWQTTLEAYRRGYPDRAAMGTLAFNDLDIRILSPRHALAFGEWRLSYPDRDDAWGLFTLLLERGGPDAAWRVVHDHTSSGS